jgi:hypothetical protein
MPIRQDKSEPSALISSLAGYLLLLLALVPAVTRNWYGALALVVGGVAALVVGSGRIYRPALARGVDSITCRYNPLREGSLYVLLSAFPAMTVTMWGQGTAWTRFLAIILFAMVVVGALLYLREWRRSLLRITPASLTVAVPAHRYGLTEIPRERIISITGGTGARRNGDTGPVTQIAYVTNGSGSTDASTVLIGPTNANNAMWVTIEQADLLAALQAWKDGDPRDPALLDRVEVLLRGGGAIADGGTPAALSPADQTSTSIGSVELPSGSPPPPAAEPSRWRGLRYAGFGLAALVGVAAVPVYQSNHRTSEAPPVISAAPQAGTVDCAGMPALPKKAPDEPTVYLPLNPGWTAQAVTPGSSEDTPNLRGFYSNNMIRDNDFTPVIQVDLIPTNSTDSLSAIAADVLNKARTMMTVSNENTAKVCDSGVYRADTSDYNPDGKGDRSGTSLITVVDGKAGARWVAVATIKTRDPDQPDYLSQREALIRGFHARS